MTDRILIVGAGPVGLCLANILADAGREVTLFERNPAVNEDLRASTVHPATLELMDRLGLADQIIDQGLKAPTWQFRDRATGPVGIFDMSLIADETRFPFRVQCEQWKINRMLFDRLSGRPNATVRFNAKAVGHADKGDHVELTVEGPDGARETVTGRFLVAADGARSVIREGAGITFEGYTHEERFLVLSTTVEFGDYLDELSFINYVADPKEWLTLLRVKDFWRVLFPVSADEPPEKIMSEENCQRLLKGVVDPGRDYDIVHRTLYQVHEKIAETYRKGRVILAGDAAHINNPLGGMGMNGGIHDAFNLGEKLLAILDGGPEDLLDRYSRQRRKVAQDFVQATALRNKQLLNERDPAEREKRLDEMRQTAADPEKARAFLLRSSMIQALRDAAAIE